MINNYSISYFAGLANQKRPNEKWRNVPYNYHSKNIIKNQIIRLGEWDGEKQLNAFDLDIYNKSVLDKYSNIIFNFMSKKKGIKAPYQTTPSGGLHIFWGSNFEIGHHDFIINNDPKNKQAIEIRAKDNLLMLAPSKVINKKGQLREYKLYGNLQDAPILDFNDYLELLGLLKLDTLNTVFQSNIEHKKTTKKVKYKNKVLGRSAQSFKKLYTNKDYFLNTQFKKISLESIFNKFNIKYKSHTDYLEFRDGFGKHTYNSKVYRENYMIVNFSDKTLNTLFQYLYKKNKSKFTEIIYEINAMDKILDPDVKKKIINQYIKEQENILRMTMAIHKHSRIIAPTGSGKTTAVIKNVKQIFPDKKIIIVNSLTSTTNQIGKKHKLSVVDGEVNQKMAEWIFDNDNIKSMTYEALLRKNDPQYWKDVVLIIDEEHNFITANRYRTKSLDKINRIKDMCYRTVGLTGTAYGLNKENVFELYYKRINNKNDIVEVSFIINEKNNKEQFLIDCENDLKKEKDVVGFVNDIKTIKKFKKYFDEKYRVGIITRETKKLDLYKNVVENEMLNFNDYDIIFTTQVIAEGTNILNKNINIKILGYNILHINEQFIARFRNGIDSLSFYYSKDSEVDMFFNLEAEIKNRINEINDFVQDFNIVNKIYADRGVDLYNNKSFKSSELYNHIKENIKLNGNGKKYIELSADEHKIRADYVIKYTSKIVKNQYLYAYHFKKNLGFKNINFYNKTKNNPDLKNIISKKLNDIGEAYDFELNDLYKLIEETNYIELEDRTGNLSKILVDIYFKDILHKEKYKSNYTKKERDMAKEQYKKIFTFDKFRNFCRLSYISDFIFNVNIHSNQ